MSNPQQETKIELVTEAIETLVLAQVVALAPDDIKPPNAHQSLMDARRLVHDALKELLTPTLRVYERSRLETIPAPDARPAYPVA